MVKKKNNYSFTFYDSGRRSNCMQFVHSYEKAIDWVEKHNIPWTHCMVYDRRTKEKIERILNPNRPIQWNYWAVFKDGVVFQENLSKTDAYALFSKMRAQSPKNKWRYQYVMQ